MITKHVFTGLRWLFLAIAVIVLVAASTRARHPLAMPLAPPAEVQMYSFSVGANDPATGLGFHPADILGAGQAVLIPCAHLGLQCNDSATAAVDDITGLSYGHDFEEESLMVVQFSAGAGSKGAAATAVRAEAGCAPAEPQADVFATGLDGANSQDLDGDGTACADNAGYGLSLAETLASDNVDALERDPCQSVDLDCDTQPEEPVYFTLAPGSPSLEAIGAGPADILAATSDTGPDVWASAADLGLSTGDAIASLCLGESGDGTFDASDRLLFALAPGSPTLARFAFSPADLLRPIPRMGQPAVLMGLERGDSLDAAICAGEYIFADLFLPQQIRSYRPD